MKAPITPAQAWAALVEHYGWAGGKAELSAGFGSINLGYTADQLQAYGKQCSEHSRERALEEAKEAIESANARRVLYVPDCIDVIEALKGKR